MRYRGEAKHSIILGGRTVQTVKLAHPSLPAERAIYKLNFLNIYPEVATDTRFKKLFVEALENMLVQYRGICDARRAVYEHDPEEDA